MTVDEQQLKKFGDEFADISHLVKLEWRQRATRDFVSTDEVARSQSLFSQSYSIEHVGAHLSYRVHGWGTTNGKGVAQVFPTDFLRDSSDQIFEPNAVSIVVSAESDEPVVISHSVEHQVIDAAVMDVSNIFTVTIRAWDLAGKPVSTRFSWQAIVDGFYDEGVIGG